MPASAASAIAPPPGLALRPLLRVDSVACLDQVPRLLLRLSMPHSAVSLATAAPTLRRSVKSAFSDDEFIVYNEAQVALRYLVRLKDPTR